MIPVLTIRKILVRYARTAVLWITGVLFTCRFLIPVGYMPTAMQGGWFIKLCDSLPLTRHVETNLNHHKTFFTEHTDSTHHGEITWEHCSLGVSIDSAPLKINLSSLIESFSVYQYFHKLIVTVLVTDLIVPKQQGPPSTK